METEYKCTNYFKGKDGLGTCDTECQWWNDGCPCAKGSDRWDGKEHYSLRKESCMDKLEPLEVFKVAHLLAGTSEKVTGAYTPKNLKDAEEVCQRFGRPRLGELEKDDLHDFILEQFGADVNDILRENLTNAIHAKFGKPKEDYTTHAIAEKLDVELWKVMELGKYFKKKFSISRERLVEIIDKFNEHYWKTEETESSEIIPSCAKWKLADAILKGEGGC